MRERFQWNGTYLHGKLRISLNLSEGTESIAIEIRTQELFPETNPQVTEIIRENTENVVRYKKEKNDIIEPITYYFGPKRSGFSGV